MQIHNINNVGLRRGHDVKLNANPLKTSEHGTFDSGVPLPFQKKYLMRIHLDYSVYPRHA